MKSVASVEGLNHLLRYWPITALVRVFCQQKLIELARRNKSLLRKCEYWFWIPTSAARVPTFIPEISTCGDALLYFSRSLSPFRNPSWDVRRDARRKKILGTVSCTILLFRKYLTCFCKRRRIQVACLLRPACSNCTHNPDCVSWQSYARFFTTSRSD